MLESHAVKQSELCKYKQSQQKVNKNSKLIRNSHIHRQHSSADLYCKGDGQSMEDPIFGPSQLGNPSTDFDKI